MLFKIKRMLLIVMIMVITFCCVEVKAYFSFDKNASVNFTMLSYNNLTIATDKTVYGTCNNVPTMTLTVTNPNNYNVSYTLSFSESKLTYKIDGASGATYTVNASSSKTHTITLSGSTTSTSLTVTLNATSPYKSSHTKTVTLDISCPTASISSTTNVATSQTATLTCSDTEGLASYYWGTKSSPVASEYTSQTSNLSTTKTVSSAGTYYLICKDKNGNTTSTSKIYRSYTVDNRLLNVTGSKGTYTTANYTSVSTSAYIMPNGTSIPLTSIYTTPSGGTYVGISSGAASTSAATLLSSNPTINANTTYTAWFNRNEYTITVTASVGGSNKVVTQNNTTGVTATNGNSKTITIRSGESLTATAIANSGYTFTAWSGLSTNTTNPLLLTPNKTGTITANFADQTEPSVYVISSTSTLKSTTQTATLKCTDDVGVTAYYFGTNASPTANDYTAIDSTTTFNITKTISSAGIYYLKCKDAAGNVSIHSVKIYVNYTIDNRLLNVTGVKGTYTSSNYTSVSSATYLMPQDESITLAQLYTTPTGGTYIGTSTGPANTTSATLLTTTTVNASNTTYTAWFNRNEYIVTVATGGNGSNKVTSQNNTTGVTATASGSDKTLTVRYGESITGTATANSGYTFTGWSGASTSTTSPVTLTITSAKTLTASFADKTAPVANITSTNSVATSQTATLRCTDGVGVTAYYFGTSSSPASSDYISITATTGLSTTSTIKSAGTYYLKCKDATGNISSGASKAFYKTTLSMTNGTVIPTSIITMSGNSFALPTPTASTGYTNKGAWYTSTSYSTSKGNYGATYTPTSSTTLYSTATANTYTIGYTYNGGTKGTNAPTSGTYDSVVTINNPTKTFTVNVTNSASATLSATSASSTQTFAGWTASNSTTSTAMYGTSSSAVTTAWSTATTKVTAQYFKNLRSTSGTVTLTANWTAVAITLPTITKNGYTCGYTATSGGSTITYASGGSYTPSTTTSSATLYTVCTPNKIKLTLNKNGGTGGTDYVWYYYGTSVFYSDEACTTQITAITRPTRTGYTFTQYYGDGTSGGTANERYIAYDSVEFANDLATDIYKDATMYALWAPNKIKLTLNKNGGTGGTDYVWYNYGTSTFYSNEALTTQITAITRPTRTGYTFVHYYGDGTSGGGADERYIAYDSTEFATDLATDIYKDATLYAKWTINSYVVTYDCSTNGGSGNTTASVNYNASVALSKTCTPASGWTFVGWSTSSIATSKLSSYTMPANNVTLYAIYSKSVTVTFNANGCTTAAGSATMTLYNGGTSGSVTVPTKTMNSGWTSLGASTSASSTSSGTAMGSSMTISGVASATTTATRYYNCSKAAITKSVTYSKGANVSAIGATSGSCTIAAVYNGASQSTSCTVTLPTITANTGYTAVGWSTTNGAASGTAAGSSYTLSSASTTLYANATDQTKPSCSFGSWSPTAIDVDDTATIVLTCTDTGSGISTTALTSSNFTVSDTSALSISTVTTASVTNGKSYTITVTGLNKTASPTVTLKASQVSDAAGNVNNAVASSAISVTADTVGPVITFGTDGNTTPAKSHSTKVTAEDASGVSTLKYYWTQTSGSSAASGTSMTNGGTATKSSGDGIWYLCAYAVDGKGNSTDKVCTNAFVFDNTKPSITSDATICVLKGTSFNLLSRVTATDANTVTLSASKTVSTTSVGTHSVTITATDSAGNSQTKAVTVYVYTKLTNETLATSGSGLYADSYTSGRYLYRGSAPNNYVTFNGSSNWRIVAVNPDRTYKLVYMSSLGDMQFHSSKVNSFSGTTLETYLKGTYYSGLSSDAKNYIVSSGYYYNGNFGSASSSDTMAANVAADRATAYTGTVGLLSASDYILASTHANCTNYYYSYNKKSSVYPCSTDNYLYRSSGSLWWIMNGHTNGNARCFGTTTSNAALKNQPATNSYAVYPVVTLKNTTTFLGSGTSSDPYTICTACLQTGLSSTTCSIAIDSGDWNTSRTLTVTASSTSGITYSWDGTNYSSTRTKTISAAGTYTAFIKDSSGMINTCSFTVNSRTEYRKASCTRYWGSWNKGSSTCSGSESTYNSNAAITKSYAESNNLNYYYSCGYDADCEYSYSFGGACYKWTRSCSAINCGSFGEWSTTYTYGTCTRKVETRTTYGV